MKIQDLSIGQESRSKRGFTLVELLVVIAIIVVLALVAVPTFNAITNGMAVSQGLAQVSQALELARDEAVARHTYVWIGFANGAGTLQIGAIYSADGTGTNNTDPSNLWPLFKPITVRNISLISSANLQPQTKDLVTKALQDSNSQNYTVAGNGGGTSFTEGTIAFTQTITFTPKGEATLYGPVGPDDGYTPYIDVSFCQSKGGTVTANANDAAVLVDGATGVITPIQAQ